MHACLGLHLASSWRTPIRMFISVQPITHTVYPALEIKAEFCIFTDWPFLPHLSELLYANLKNLGQAQF